MNLEQPGMTPANNGGEKTINSGAPEKQVSPEGRYRFVSKDGTVNTYATFKEYQDAIQAEHENSN